MNSDEFLMNRSDRIHSSSSFTKQYNNSTFTKKEFSNVLNDQESKVFKDFISRARKLGIIELASSKKQGEYQFTNQLYPMYFMIQTFKEENMGK